MDSLIATCLNVIVFRKNKERVLVKIAGSRRQQKPEMRLDTMRVKPLQRVSDVWQWHCGRIF